MDYNLDVASPNNFHSLEIVDRGSETQLEMAFYFYWLSLDKQT